MPRSKDDPEAVDGYLAALPDQERKTLEELRQFIKASVPDVQERISYGGAVIGRTWLASLLSRTTCPSSP